jgi:predicted small lipoprotein YifL
MKNGIAAFCLTVVVLALAACGGSGSGPMEFSPEPAAAPPSPTARFQLVENGPLVEERASTGGVSWADFDGDGDEDIFVTNGYDVSAQTPAPQKNRLYRNDGGGVFVPVESGPLTGDDGYSSGSSWADFDNDGDLDLFVPNQQDQENFLYRNDAGSFTRILDSSPAVDQGHSYSAAWVDVDRDGLLDLFVANGGLSHSGPDFLYRNEGEGRFSRITEGAVVTTEGASGSAVWGDCDDDGDQDLFVANRAGNNALYRNDGDWQLTLIEQSPLGTDGAPALAADWGDMDNDGDLDLYVGTMYGMANLLYRNDGGGLFTVVEEGAAVLDAGHTYGAGWADADNDGDLDLAVVNWGAAPVLYLNDGKGLLTRGEVGDLGRRIAFAGCAAWADPDNDGDLDFYIGSWPNEPGPGEQNQLYRNETSRANWLKIRLEGSVSNRSAIGARITVQAQIQGRPVSQIREVSAQNSFRSQNSLIQHFGLGDADRIFQLTVHWPSGGQSMMKGVPVNQLLEIREDQ